MTRAASFPTTGDSVNMPVFAPSRVVEINQTGDTPGVWQPQSTDRVFFATEEFSSLVITNSLGVQTSFRLPENFPLGITPNTTYTFSDNSTNLIVVM